MTTDNFGGNSSTTTSATKPKNTTTTTQSNKQTTPTVTPTSTQQSAPSVAEKELNQKGITAATADTEDDFLRGFNEGFENTTAPPLYTSQQATTQTSSPSAWDDSQKTLSHKGITSVAADSESYKYITGYDPLFDENSRDPDARTLRDKGITPVYDEFLSGFNEGYEENAIATAPESRDPNFWDLTVNSFKYGYNDSARGQEAWKSMHGQENELDKYNELLSSEEYNFEADDWWEKMLSGASQQVGQWVKQLTDPDTAALAIGSGGAALLAGQAGPQVLLPEEILTVPLAFTAGMKAGNAKTNMEIEGGRAYLEMLNNGVSEETARAIATGVGGVNALLETAQLDELLKAYKVLGKAGADDTFLDIVLRELKKRGIDTVTETLQEDLQELVTIGGAQLGSKIDTGEWAYNLGEVGTRLWDTAKESALTFGLTNIPSTVHNVSTQNHNRLIAAGEANIMAGKLPTSEQLAAMNMSEADALGAIVLQNLEQADGGITGTAANDPDHIDSVTEAINGARITEPESSAARAHANRYYGLVRSMTTDVKRIAENTGYSEDEIQRIKNHIFMDEHDLGGSKPRRFYPSFEMAQSWQRLIAGTPEPHDLTMLQHEIFESELMRSGMSQNDAHIEASKKYNYAKESDDYYGSFGQR